MTDIGPTALSVTSTMMVLETRCIKLKLKLSEKKKENAKYAKIWKVFARLNETSDAISGDVYYHINC